ncbi:hypothetical protein DIPPA_31102 [Diplonema papillatum]|nr:hypothetical protein DIPPA_31102 [Diplonema papillatum]
MITSVGARTADVPVLGDSIKRGAVDHLVCAKAAGAPFPEHLISRLAKHRRQRRPDVGANDGEVHVGCGGTGARVEIGGGDRTPVKGRKRGHDDPRRFMRQHHSVFKRGKQPRLPKTEDEKASPLHVDNVRLMNVGLLRGRMNETTRARFDETWRRTFDVAKLRRSSSRRVSRL